MNVAITMPHRAALLTMRTGEVIRVASSSGRSMLVRVIEIDWPACVVVVRPLGWLARAWLWLRRRW